MVLSVCGGVVGGKVEDSASWYDVQYWLVGGGCGGNVDGGCGGGGD